MFFTRLEKLKISIVDCVHYCGFRYGHNEVNPYENYVRGLHQNRSINELRKEFTHFLLHYRPRHFGEALRIELMRKYPLWQYPWNRRYMWRHHPGAWRSSFSDIPDILTHFSEKGVSRQRVVEEFYWLERAYYAIADSGYQPIENGYVRVSRLVHEDGRTVFLVRDGNHRLSAMSALGFETLLAEHDTIDTVYLELINDWHSVRNGVFSRDDARAIFEAYFIGNKDYCTTTIPVPICP